MSLYWLTIAQIERGVTRLNFPVFGRLPCRYHPSRQIGHCPSEPRWQPNGSVWPAACMHKTKRWYFRKNYKLNLYKPFWLQLRARSCHHRCQQGVGRLKDTSPQFSMKGDASRRPMIYLVFQLWPAS